MPYFKFKNANGEPYGSFEVFYATEGMLSDNGNGKNEAGWYWWACFPGALPDGDPVGPFVTGEAAKEHALNE